MQGVYLFESQKDFIQALKELNNHCKTINTPNNIFYLTKHLNSYVDVDKEISFIDKCIINSFNGFKTKKQIKLTITDSLNCRYCVTYCFNSSCPSGVYARFNRYLKKRTKVYV